MSLTLITNPVGSATSKFFAGYQPCEFIFKREDLAITSVTSGTGGAKINHAGDLTSLLSAGDTIYLYSEATNYIYDGSFEIITIVAGEITIDTPYVVTGTGGYINYFKNYYVELQCVHPTLPDFNRLPFSLESDGDAAGNITIDVSIINELNTQRGEISEQFLSDSVTEFEVKYRQVYSGSSESFTLVDNKLVIMLHCIEVPDENQILNDFDLPKLYLGYPSAVVAAITDNGASSTCEMLYNELDLNENVIASGTLGTLDADVNGFLLFEWESGISVDDQTKMINFKFNIIGIYDFATPDFATPDFVVS